MVLVLCCLLGLAFGNVAGHPSKREREACKRAQGKEQVVILTSLPAAHVAGGICTAGDDLNCLFCGMWPEECLGLPLGLSDVTQELSYTTHASAGCSSFAHLTGLLRL